MTTTDTPTRVALFLGAAAAVAAGSLGFLGFAQHPDTDAANASTPPSFVQPVDRLEEDELGWDCATMGNKRCGPVQPPCAVDQTFTWDGVVLTPAPATTNPDCIRVDTLYRIG